MFKARWFNIELNNKEVPEYIVIYNGSHESEEKYYSNNRIKELVITIEDEKYVKLPQDEVQKYLDELIEEAEEEEY